MAYCRRRVEVHALACHVHGKYVDHHFHYALHNRNWRDQFSNDNAEYHGDMICRSRWLVRNAGSIRHCFVMNKNNTHCTL